MGSWDRRFTPPNRLGIREGPLVDHLGWTESTQLCDADNFRASTSWSLRNIAPDILEKIIPTRLDPDLMRWLLVVAHTWHDLWESVYLAA